MKRSFYLFTLFLLPLLAASRSSKFESLVGSWVKVSGDSKVQRVVFYPNQRIQFISANGSIFQRLIMDEGKGKVVDSLLQGRMEYLDIVGRVVESTPVKITIMHKNYIKLHYNNREVTLLKMSPKTEDINSRKFR